MTDNQDFRELLTMDDLSRLYNINKSTLYQMVSRREIRSIKIGKRIFFRQVDIDEFVTSKIREPKNTKAVKAISIND